MKKTSDKKFTRRSFLLSSGGALMVGATAVSLVPSSAKAINQIQAGVSSQGIDKTPASIQSRFMAQEAKKVGVVQGAQSSVDDLLHSISGNLYLADNWYMNTAHLVESGYIQVNLVNQDGRQAEVQIFKRQGLKNGIEASKQFEIFLMNHGMGRKSTDNDLNRAIIALSQAINKGKINTTFLSKMTTWKQHNRI